MDVLRTFEDNSIDSIVTDPPYELGFMGKSWDKSGIAFNTEVWSECLRVLKPGGHMLAFGGSRTFHRIAVAIEDAGFDLRDTIMWVYGSGFPKSHDISKAIDKTFGKEAEREVIGYNRQGAKNIFGGKPLPATLPVTLPATPEAQMWEGWGTALKPAFEPIILARKPISEKNIAENVLKWGTGGINIDDCRVEYNGAVKTCSRKSDGIKDHTNPSGWKEVNRTPNRPATPTEAGRWPANIIFDEEAGKILDEQSGILKTGGGNKANKKPKSRQSQVPFSQDIGEIWKPDIGGASRFFYCAKASRKERNIGLDDVELKQSDETRKEELIGGNNPYNRGAKPVKNNHPTVKPLKLMEYLVKLITPPNGIVLDPFQGSGSTQLQCIVNNVNYVLIELNKEYVEIQEKRIQENKNNSIQQKLFEE